MYIQCKQSGIDVDKQKLIHPLGRGHRGQQENTTPASSWKKKEVRLKIGF